MNDLLFFCLVFFSLSPLLRRVNSMLLLLLLLPHRWMIGCDDIYTTGRLFSFLALLMILQQNATGYNGNDMDG